jgi:hypothetical protein
MTFEYKCTVHGTKEFMDHFIGTDSKEPLKIYFEDFQKIGSRSSGKIIIFLGKSNTFLPEDNVEDFLNQSWVHYEDPDYDDDENWESKCWVNVQTWDDVQKSDLEKKVSKMTKEQLLDHVDHYMYHMLMTRLELRKFLLSTNPTSICKKCGQMCGPIRTEECDKKCGACENCCECYE